MFQQNKSQPDECACCYVGGKQCEHNKFKFKCIGPVDSQHVCQMENKLRVKGKMSDSIKYQTNTDFRKDLYFQ